MTTVPIVPHLQPDPSSALARKAEKIAAELLRENKNLSVSDELQESIPDQIDDGSTLHIDDLTEISLLDSGSDIRFYQDRARLRAYDDDTIVSTSLPVESYEDYCRDYLGLGQPTWLRPAPRDNPLHVAEAAWNDREVRRELVRRVRQHELATIHPHMGTTAVWELASLLRRASHRPVHVVAPPPGVSHWANDKVEFTSAVSQLFGPSLVPQTTSAWNLSIAAIRTRDIASKARVIGLKIPDSAGGGGNIVLNSIRIVGRTATEVEEILRNELRPLNWDGHQPLLISAWECDALCSPSAQLWIPPNVDEPPVIEGLFVQSMIGKTGMFTGNRPAQLPHAITAEIVDRCWLLGRLFQLVGYVGRCSFDLILLGDNLANARIEFIECNGRWGGTSLPMTLMNRLFGDWTTQPHAVHVCRVPGLNRLAFDTLLASLGTDLFDVRTGNGRFVLYGPGRMPAQSGITAIGLADEWDSAYQAAFVEFPEILHRIVREADLVTSRC